MIVFLKTGVLPMSVETYETIRDKLAQSRRLLQQTTDPSIMDRLRIYIEELEGRLMLEMSEGRRV
jgi:hypothetical protein